MSVNDSIIAAKKLFTAEARILAKKSGKDCGRELSARTGMSQDSLELLQQLLAGVGRIEAVLTAGGANKSEVETAADDVTETEMAASERKAIEVAQLKTEVRALSLAIQNTKSEIAALRPAQAKDDRLVAVANELDAIVIATEDATNTILTSAEKIDAIAHQLQAQARDAFSGQAAEDLRETVVAIFEACNFQDITGQRINKVVTTLQFVEERVNKMIEIWGADTFEDCPAPPEVEKDSDQKLLNGPALEGVSQSDIDAMFG